MNTQDNLKRISDKLEKVIEVLVDHCNAEEASHVNMKRYLAKVMRVTDNEAPRAIPKEEAFSSLLAWTPGRGEKLGPFESTNRRANNNSDAFNHAYNILKRNDHAINKPLVEKGWTHRYWYFGEDRIFRKKNA